MKPFGQKNVFLPMPRIFSRGNIAPWSKSKIIFLHIPKTAGMCLRGLFTRNYRGTIHFNTEVRHIGAEDWQDCLDKLKKIPGDELDHYGVFKGHMLLGLHEILPGPVEYITFLRDPIRRIVSHYKMMSRFPGFPANHEIDPSQSEWNLGEYPAFLRSLDNYQTRLLAGADPALAFGACSEEHLSLARVNIDRLFKFVGLTEQFDLSLMLLRHVCGWDKCFYMPDNVTPDNHFQMSDRVLEELRRLNRLDFELYRYAQERFDLLVDRYGWRLKAEWRIYRLGNRLHQGFHRWRHKVKHRFGIERRKAMGI